MARSRCLPEKQQKAEKWKGKKNNKSKEAG